MIFFCWFLRVLRIGFSRGLSSRQEHVVVVFSKMLFSFESGRRSFTAAHGLPDSLMRVLILGRVVDVMV